MSLVIVKKEIIKTVTTKNSFDLEYLVLTKSPEYNIKGPMMYANSSIDKLHDSGKKSGICQAKF